MIYSKEVSRPETVNRREKEQLDREYELHDRDDDNDAEWTQIHQLTLLKVSIAVRTRACVNALYRS